MEGTRRPAQIGRYEIRGELGRGMMGVVYEAHDPALGRTIALKTIRPAQASTDGERADYERRFVAEAQIAARLSHPGIVVVHDVGRDAEQDILYIALEHLQGRTLAERVAEGALDWREALALVGRVAEALHYAHTQGIVHRDVKPANIMVLPAGDPKILDFGIAKLESGNLTSPGQFFGTPLYMSPEQALGHAVDARTDLFSLGSVAYLLLSGRPPFEAPNVPGILARVAYQHARPLSEIGRGVPPDAEYVVGRAMAKDPGDRYPDGRAMAEDVEDVLAGRPPRHRADWTAPEPGEATLVASGALVPPPPRPPATAVRSLPPAAAVRLSRSRRIWRLRLPLVMLLAATVAGYFYVRPGDAKFWRRIAAAVRRAAVVAEGPIAPAAFPTPALTGAAPSPAAAVAALARVHAPEGPPRPGPPAGALASPADRESEPAPPADSPAPASSPAFSVAAAAAAQSEAADAGGRLAIEFEHHLRSGNLQVWVDGTPVFEEDFDAQETRRILALTLRKGVVQEVLTLPPGDHEVTVQVRWDENVKTSRISGRFPPGSTRRLDVALARVGGKLSLNWR